MTVRVKILLTDVTNRPMAGLTFEPGSNVACKPSTSMCTFTADMSKFLIIQLIFTIVNTKPI